MSEKSKFKPLVVTKQDNLSNGNDINLKIEAYLVDPKGYLIIVDGQEITESGCKLEGHNLTETDFMGLNSAQLTSLLRSLSNGDTMSVDIVPKPPQTGSRNQ